LFDIGVDGGEQETDGEMLAETEEVPYECGPRQKYPMLFEEPIPLQVSDSFNCLVGLKSLLSFFKKNILFMNK
jgi:hypothetical protein